MDEAALEGKRCSILWATGGEAVDRFVTPLQRIKGIQPVTQY